MNFRTTLVIPKQMKEKIISYSREIGIHQSEFIRSAIVDKLQKLEKESVKK